MIIIECIGGGGSGAGGTATSAGHGGGAGGGGALARMSFPAESLGETLTVTVGAVPSSGANAIYVVQIGCDEGGTHTVESVATSVSEPSAPTACHLGVFAVA